MFGTLIWKRLIKEKEKEKKKYGKGFGDEFKLLYSLGQQWLNAMRRKKNMQWLNSMCSKG